MVNHPRPSASSAVEFSVTHCTCDGSPMATSQFSCVARSGVSCNVAPQDDAVQTKNAVDPISGRRVPPVY